MLSLNTKKIWVEIFTPTELVEMMKSEILYFKAGEQVIVVRHFTRKSDNENSWSVRQLGQKIEIRNQEIRDAFIEKAKKILKH